MHSTLSIDRYGEFFTDADSDKLSSYINGHKLIIPMTFTLGNPEEELPVG